jgi:diadenosine tetraphosphate (Ap4A) HIT family hydrolase
MQIIAADNKIVDIDCIGCAIAQKEVLSFEELIYESNNFIVSQDFETPIPGFIILSTKRHINSILDFSKEETQEFMDVLIKIRQAIKEVPLIRNITLIQKEIRPHFHLWFFPSMDWMDEFGDKLESITKIIEYAKKNMKTEENLKEVKQIANNLKKYLKDK